MSPKIDELIYWGDDNCIYEGKLEGETPRSWIVWNGHKLPKKGTQLRTREEYELFCWQRKHRYEIKAAVERCSAETLKKVAEVIGYK